MKHSSTPREIETILQKRLREKGYKLTSQRLAIISLLSKDMTHPGAADILKKIRKSLPQVSMSTVYYTLDMLKKTYDFGEGGAFDFYNHLIGVASGLAVVFKSVINQFIVTIYKSIGRIVSALGRLTSALHTGELYTYVGWIFLGGVIILLLLVL